MSLGKWVGISAGWFFGGPIGAIIGYYIGKNFFNGKNDNEKAYEISLLILASLVIKADGKVRKVELNYVKDFFSRTFGHGIFIIFKPIQNPGICILICSIIRL